jgi:hypothetical protein
MKPVAMILVALAYYFALANNFASSKTLKENYLDSSNIVPISKEDFIAILVSKLDLCFCDFRKKSANITSNQSKFQNKRITDSAIIRLVNDDCFMCAQLQCIIDTGPCIDYIGITSKCMFFLQNYHE